MRRSALRMLVVVRVDAGVSPFPGEPKLIDDMVDAYDRLGPDRVRRRSCRARSAGAPEGR